MPKIQHHAKTDTNIQPLTTEDCWQFITQVTCMCTRSEKQRIGLQSSFIKYDGHSIPWFSMWVRSIWVAQIMAQVHTRMNIMAAPVHIRLSLNCHVSSTLDLRLGLASYLQEPG